MLMLTATAAATIAEQKQGNLVQTTPPQAAGTTSNPLRQVHRDSQGKKNTGNNTKGM